MKLSNVIMIWQLSLPWQYFLTSFLVKELFMRCKWRLCSNSCKSFYVHCCCLTYLFTYLLTCLHTPWSRGLLEKLTGSQLVKKFPAFYGTRGFITAYKSTRHVLPTVLLRSYYRIGPGPKPLWIIRNMIRFYGEELLATRPTPQPEGPPLVCCPLLLI